VIHRLRELPSNEGFFYRAPDEADKHSAKVAVKNYRFRSSSEVACIAQQDGSLMIVKTPMAMKKMEPWLVQDITSKVERTCGPKFRFQPFYIGTGISQYSEEVERMRFNGAQYLKAVSSMNTRERLIVQSTWTGKFNSRQVYGIEGLMDLMEEDPLASYYASERKLQMELSEF
jgi:hypothetical protein